MIFESIILGIIQGITEFLPVSSSGHLVIFGSLLNINTPGALFEAILHLGTTSAVIIFFRKKILEINISEIKLFIIATIPVGIIGFLFKDFIEALFDSTKMVGFFLIITGVINLLVDRYEGRKENLDFFDSLIIGIAQAFAIFPGISRSGSTILAGKSMNLSGQRAAEFSFLLSIPAIIGANILEISTHGLQADQNISIYIVGFLSALMAGLISINLVLKFLKEKKFKYFGVYCFLAGILTLIFL